MLAVGDLFILSAPQLLQSLVADIDVKKQPLLGVLAKVGGGSNDQWWHRVTDVINSAPA